MFSHLVLYAFLVLMVSLLIAYILEYLVNHRCGLAGAIHACVLKMRICLQSCQGMFIAVSTVPVLIRPLSEVNTNAE